MAHTFGQSAYDLAKSAMEDHRETFPPKDFDDLVVMLARDIQGAIDDMIEPDYLDINLATLRRQREHDAEYL